MNPRPRRSVRRQTMMPPMVNVHNLSDTGIRVPVLVPPDGWVQTEDTERLRRLERMGVVAIITHDNSNSNEENTP